jgi:hypothetical protein
MDNTVDEAGGERVANCLLSRTGETRQRGTIAIMFAVLLPVIVACYGLALDLARIYSRKAEMQAIAGTIAIAAAKKLNGTATGVSDAIAAARDVLQQGSDPIFWPKFGYVKTMVWSDAAIMFGKTADGSSGWLDAGAAAAAPRGLSFIKVDTSALNASYGEVNMLFAPVLSSSLTTVTVDHTAIAGRGRINVTPLGICAMSTAPNHFTNRSNLAGYDELVEYGFRRGVGYNLMMLNPLPGSTTGVTYLVDPITLTSTGSSPTNLLATTVSPYVCTGTMALPKLVGETVNVRAGFPLGSLVNQLNSRFEIYTGACEASTAPADRNIKQYTAGPTLGWMMPKPPATSQTAAMDSSIKLQTKADLNPPNNWTTTNTGPLWAFAKAVPWSSYTAGQPEPAGGYTPFPTVQATWNALYGNAVTLGTYPAASTPYVSMASQPTNVMHRPGIANRRVLNLPILDCATMPSSTARVLTIGRFFMTVPAVSSGPTNTISAEFAGVTSDVQAGGSVELVQ